MDRCQTSAEAHPALEARCQSELSQLLLAAPNLDKASADQATAARKRSQQLFQDADELAVQLAVLHAVEQMPCDAIPEAWGLSEEERSLTKLVAEAGAGRWEEKAAEMAVAHPGAFGWDCTRRPGSWCGHNSIAWRCTHTCTSGVPNVAGVLRRSALEVEHLWLALAPRLAEHLASDPNMPCGHSCSTCPTRSTCNLHDSLEKLACHDGLDMEDFASAH